MERTLDEREHRRPLVNGTVMHDTGARTKRSAFLSCSPVLLFTCSVRHRRTEAEGFEPPVQLPARRFSKPVPSAARARLLMPAIDSQ